MHEIAVKIQKYVFYSEVWAKIRKKPLRYTLCWFNNSSWKGVGQYPPACTFSTTNTDLVPLKRSSVIITDVSKLISIVAESFEAWKYENRNDGPHLWTGKYNDLWGSFHFLSTIRNVLRRLIRYKQQTQLYCCGQSAAAAIIVVMLKICIVGC